MSLSWKEVQQAREEKRCEIVISGPAFAERIEKNGLDPGLFAIPNLNFIEITKTCLKELPPAVGELSNLTSMVISHNEIAKIPPEIANLKKLKVLDVSHNALTNLPSEMSQLLELQSLNASCNRLEALPSFSGMLKLIRLNVCNNKFKELPKSLCDPALVHFSELIANGNEIAEIPVEIGQLGNLKVLNLGDNALSSIPGELGSCTKLKELNLKGNRLKDRRLLKLVEQCHVKQVMDYVRSNCPRASSGSETGKQAKTKKQVKQAKKTNEQDEIVDLLDELKVLSVSEDPFKVVSSQHVADVRPYVVCCKVLDVNLSGEGVLKKFITLQTKLHDTICEKRTVATIATHDFSKIQGNLLYDARLPEDIKITSLNKKKEMTAKELYKELNDEADALRKEKKKNSYSGVHKFLYLLKDKPVYPCITDASGLVVSFPPITNSEGTKISESTKCLLLEVTGNNLNLCKKVMDSLLLGMLRLGLGNTTSHTEDEEEEVQRNFLSVQQVRIVDETGQLKCVYPSRTDIPSEGIVVNRA